MELTTNTAPLLIIRLGKKWKPAQEEIERGYFRTSQGWHPHLTDLELADSVRAWWKLSEKTLEKKGVEHVAAYAEGRTQALYRIVSVMAVGSRVIASHFGSNPSRVATDPIESSVVTASPWHFVPARPIR